MGELYFDNIRAMEAHYYGNFNPDMTNDLLKADAPMLTSTTGFRQVVFGRKMWENIVIGAHTFGIIPKQAWERSGYRVITTAASTGGLGIGEAGDVPETIKATLQQITTAPKIEAWAYEMSSTELALEGKDDTVYWADKSAYMAKEFANNINRDLLQDNDTLAGSNFESIDRVCGSYSEINGVGQTANDLDIYGLDRDGGATFADAYVNHDSGNDRPVALSHLNSLIQNQAPYWDNFATMTNRVWITGFDTHERIQQLLQAQQRFPEGEFSTSINGISTYEGKKGGFTLSTYRGAPMFPDNNVQQDTISRIYLLDLEHLFMGILKPVQHVESENPLIVGKFTRKAVDSIEGELICNVFGAQGKVRDLL